MQTVKISNNEYLRSHGKTPRGRGYWGFLVMKRGQEIGTIFATGDLTLKDAKNDAATKAKQIYPDWKHIDLEVAP